MKRLVAGFLAVLMVLVGCVAAGAEGMTPGTYTAEAEGFHGTIKLEVTVDAEAITGIEVVEHSETAGIGEAALPVLVESVLEHQTTGVDSVAGATVTSEAFKAALTDALTQAGADMDKMSQPVEADELEAVTMEADVVVVGAGAEGDAIAMVEPLDADLINMDLINTQPNSMILPSGLGQYCNPGVSRAYAAGGFMVNQDGERFFNEQANAWDLMQAMKANDAQYLIMDQAAFDGFNAGMTGSKIYTMEDVETWLADDYEGQPVMKTAATLEELADKLGIPADALSASAQAFNEAAASGSADEFGRTPAAAQSEEGPYYALEMHIRYYASLGGLHINDGMQVLNTQQEAIPGLYAAGEVVGGLEGDVYMGGTLFGWAIASGYEAGIAAAAYTAE